MVLGRVCIWCGGIAALQSPCSAMWQILHVQLHTMLCMADQFLLHILFSLPQPFPQSILQVVGPISGDDGREQELAAAGQAISNPSHVCGPILDAGVFFCAWGGRSWRSSAS
jgi:hypothetical protein